MVVTMGIEGFREGIWQMRPALGGWQWRWRAYGFTWSAWGFRLGRRTRIRQTIQAELGPGFTYTDEAADGEAD